MPNISWNEEKNKLLKETRGIGFDEIVKALQFNKNTISIPHPNHREFKNQQIFIVIINKYTYAVPYVQEKNYIFLKTIYPSRKYQKQYNKKEKI
jgi:uncharacterized DUF497 family protein